MTGIHPDMPGKKKGGKKSGKKSGKKGGKKGGKKSAKSRSQSAKSEKGDKSAPDIMSPAAMENLYYIAHDAPDALDKRGFGWPDAGKKKGKKGKGKKKKK
ncbi:small lysine-rich protein 1-like [Saccostrea cucullata]|uniref:small lysine-rich protein 1-like n=1 Tax=Saccostrea cuccullata TaxID=36930 RepID=UPI002ED591AC